MFQELKRLIEQMGKDRGIDKQIIIEALESAMLNAAKKKMGSRVDIEARYNEEAGEIEVFQFKTVEEKVTDPDREISMAEARATFDEEAEPGDSLGIKVETSTFGRIAVQAAKQIIIQRVKDAERDNIYDEYKGRVGELINGFVQRFDGGNIIVNLGRAEGIIPIGEQIYREAYKRGERIRGYVFEVKKITKGPQIILSRTHPGFLKALFEMEVPEISEGLIEIVSVAREPGKRSKIAVKTKDKDIDPVGACVGMRGSRVQSVVQELRGEKIDIVPFAEDQAKYVCSALSPAKVNRVLMDEDNRAMEVIVPDDQLSLAIGKKGQNVRLAVKLTGWKIDVKSESIAASQVEEGYKALTKVPGIDEATAESLFNMGWKNVAALAAAEVESLSFAAGIPQERISVWIDAAGKLIDQESPVSTRQKEKTGRMVGK